MIDFNVTWRRVPREPLPVLSGVHKLHVGKKNCFETCPPFDSVICYIVKKIYLCSVATNLIEEAQDLSSGLLSARLVVVHDAESGRQHNVTKATGRKNVLHPLLNVLVKGNVYGCYQKCSQSHNEFFITRQEDNKYNIEHFDTHKFKSETIIKL